MDLGEALAPAGVMLLLAGVLAVSIGSGSRDEGGYGISKGGEVAVAVGMCSTALGLIMMLAAACFRPSVETREAVREDVEVYWLQELDGGAYLEPLPDGSGWRCLGVAEEGGGRIVTVPDEGATLTQALGAPRAVLTTYRTIERPRLASEPGPIVEALWPHAVEDARKPDGECEVLAESRVWRVEVPEGGLGDGEERYGEAEREARLGARGIARKGGGA